VKSVQTSLECKQNILARVNLLKKAHEKPQAMHPAVQRACESQSSLAAFDFPEFGITPMSRNSMYKYADSELSDYQIPENFKHAGKSGRFYLDWLRIEVKTAGAGKRLSSRSKSSRDARSRQQIADLEEAVRCLKMHSLSVSKAYLNLLGCVKGLYKDANLEPALRQRLINILNDHDRLYSDVFNEVGTVRPTNLEVF
jgi:hypothetical protein